MSRDYVNRSRGKVFWKSEHLAVIDVLLRCQELLILEFPQVIVVVERAGSDWVLYYTMEVKLIVDTPVSECHATSHEVGLDSAVSLYEYRLRQCRSEYRRPIWNWEAVGRGVTSSSSRI